MKEEVEKEMKAFLQNLSQLDREGLQREYTYSYKEDTLLIYEKRIRDDSEEDSKMAVVRLNYIKSRNVWKIYIRHNRFDWNVYKPQSEVKSLKEAVNLMREDKYSMFFR